MLALYVQIITESGDTVTVRLVHSLTYTKVCPYCSEPFNTEDPRRIYDKDSCKTLTSYYRLNASDKQ